MKAIRVLSPHMVNKIAAGEVIERPASVVKELVENAIDAGATRIDVVIEKGGKQSIAVIDDGAGMGPDDLALVFVPHATSKVATDEDLFAIGTMGFRGEAMASVASISHTHIRTRRPADQAGHELEASGDHAGQVRPCASAAGTTVTVRDLFFNTPARRKFLRADSTEAGHISEAIARVALAHTHIAFSLTHNGRKSLNLPATDSLRQRVADLYGADMAEELLEIRGSDTPQDIVGVSGLVGPPGSARATAKWQYFLLNGRYIRDRFLGHALKEAFRGLIDPNRQPVAFVSLRVPADAVDVNVHPTKIEVRFRDGQSVHSHLLAALRETLQRAEIRPNAKLEAPVGDPELPDDDRRRGLRQALAEFFKNQMPAEPKLSFPEAHDREPPHGQTDRPAYSPRPAEPHTQARDPWLGRHDNSREPLAPHAAPHPPMPGDSRTEPAAADQAGSADAPFVLQVHNTYLIAADAEGLLIIDQHALHERILYDQLLRRITTGKLESQRLLLPATLKITPDQQALLAEQTALLERLGIEVSEFGPATAAIQRFPTFLNKLDPAQFLSDALDKLAEGDPSLGGEQLVHDLLDMMACKAAIKAGDPLSQQEIRELLAQRHGADKSTACPHGRPTQIRITLRDLDKQFKRT